MARGASSPVGYFFLDKQARMPVFLGLLIWLASLQVAVTQSLFGADPEIARWGNGHIGLRHLVSCKYLGLDTK